MRTASVIGKGTYKKKTWDAPSLVRKGNGRLASGGETTDMTH